MGITGLIKRIFRPRAGAPRQRQLQQIDGNEFRPWPEGGYLVGGAVRDALLGREVTDLDWLVAQPERAASLAASLVDGAHFALDEQRGHWRVVTSGSIRDYIALDGPLKTNLLERDFTINALALSADGELVDPVTGVIDLKAGLLRMISRENLQADPLRLLRAVRLATELELELEPDTAAAVRELSSEHAAGRLPLPAWERSRSELDRILLSPRAAAGLKLLDELKLLDSYLPELAQGRGVDQGGMHHQDVLDHQLESLGHLLLNFPDADLSLRWATLLHDIGKPDTWSQDEQEDGGRIRFHGHERLGGDMARSVMQRLRQPSARTERVAALVRRHMQPLPRDEKSTRRFLHRYGELLPDLLSLMVADREAARGRLASEAARKNYRVAIGRVLQALNEAPPAAAQPLFSGAELMEMLELEPGPKVGEAVRYLAELQAVGDAENAYDAEQHLREYARVQWGDQGA